MAACPACGTENPEAARFCNACGERLPEAEIAAEVRKTVTVVFCDVTGSTALGERLDPEALRRVMSRYFATMTEAIERHGGTVEKFIGDAVMAVFGIPSTHEDDALRAVRAASEMREALRRLNKELERDHGATLECRIGVNTGEVVAGDASVRQALVTGDAVNVAARLEQAARPGEVLMAEVTHRLVRDAVVADAVEPLELKGKRERIAAHRLLTVHAGAAGVARRLDSPLVGRTRQLAKLRQAFEEVAEERVCHLFTILGPPGVGKSRLLQEALGQVGEGWIVLRGRCLSYGEGITYWPLAEIVRDAIGPDGSPERGDPTAAIADLVTDDPSGDEVAVRVSQLVGGSIDVAAPPEELGWAVRRFLEAMARARPLAVVLEDLHWAEPQLLDLVDQVADLSRDAPILLACLARPDLLELRPGWGGGKLHATTASLEPLSEQECQRLVENLLAGGSLDRRTRDRIVAAADGNPLFVEETIGMLVDDGLLQKQGETWNATRDLTEVAVPPTIQALLAARLDRLDEIERAVLGRASVMGDVFYVDAVGALGPTGDGSPTARILPLVRRDLLRPEVSDLPGHEAFRFHHALLRDAAYQMLPKEVRADLHERFADWLAATAMTIDTDEFVGYHLEQAHRYLVELGPEDEDARALADRAADRLSAAGTRAFERGDRTAAEKLLRRAVALRSSEDPRRSVDLLTLGWVALDADRATDAREAFSEALDLARSAREERLEAHAELGMATSGWLVDPEGGSVMMADVVDRLLPRFEAWGDEHGSALAYLCRSQIHWNHCRFERARRDCMLAVDHARAGGDATVERLAAQNAVAAALLGPTDAEGIRTDLAGFERGVGGLPSSRPLALMTRAVLAAMVGDLEGARSLREQGFDMAKELFGEVPAGGLEAGWQSEMLAGDPRVAEGLARLQYEQISTYGDVAHASTVAGHRATSLLELGQVEEARRLADECRRTSASDDAVNQVIWRSVVARVLAAEGRFEEASRLIAEAVEWSERTDMVVEQARTRFDQAEIHRLEGRKSDARTALLAARALCERKGIAVWVERADRRLAELDA
ncbi:MAG TPA: adenylate/guanylate cyclase domain-containing protein [Actinomycetota bacterium]|nr:adenylate/guanylate cyclase domain-containing protein [Actinomycetota bacterium]